MLELIMQCIIQQENCDNVSQNVISNLLDIDYIHSDIHVSHVRFLLATRLLFSVLGHQYQLLQSISLKSQKLFLNRWR